MKHLFAILLLISSLLTFGQNLQKYKGKVIDAETNETLSGAYVRIKNANLGQITNTKGEFKITINENDKNDLMASFVGYKVKTVSFESDFNILIEMEKTIYQADEVIVSGTRMGLKSSSAISNISAKSIEKINSGQDLPFLLNQTPSLVTTSDAGAGIGYTGLRIRGTDATRINVMVNGIPINDSESQGVYWVNMPDLASSVSSIQIQRGVGTSTNGTAAFGASVNIQSNQFHEKSYVNSSNSVGSFNTFKNNLSFGTGLLNKKWALDGRLSNISSDGYVDRGWSKLKSYYGTVAHYGTKSFIRLVNFGGKEKTYQAWNGVSAEKLKTDRTYNDFTYPNQTDNYYQNHTQLLSNHTISSKLNLSANLHYTKGKGYYEEQKLQQNLADYGKLVSPNGEKLDLIRQKWLDNDFFGTTFSAEYNSSKKLKTILGGGWNKYLGDHFGDYQLGQNWNTSQNTFRWYQNQSTKTDFNIYAKSYLQINDKLSSFVDLQYRNLGLEMEGTASKLQNINQTQSYSFFNPKAGATYSLNEEQSLNVSYSVGQKEPNRTDFVDNAIGKTPKSEKLNDLELSYNLDKNDLKLSFNFYHMAYQNQLVVTGAINDVGEPIRTNIDDTYRAGLETELTWQINKKWAWGGNLTISKNKIKNFTEQIPDYEGNYKSINHTNTDLALSPNIVAGSTLVFKPTKNLEVGLMGKYVGRQFLDNTSNKNRNLNPYHSLDLRVNYSLKHIDLGLFVYNFSNQLYENNGYTYSYLYEKEVYTENYFYPQAGRNFMLSANFKF